MRKKKIESAEMPAAEITQEPVEHPAAEPVKRRIINHRVAPTDTLDSIAGKYGVSREGVISSNMWEYPSIAAGTVLPGWTLSITVKE